MLTLSPIEQKLFFSTQRAKHGLVTMEGFKQLGLCSIGTLKVVVSRLQKKGALLKLKNGVYFWNVGGVGGLDVFYAAQNIFNGYIAFSSALYLHKLFDEFPFTVFVATRDKSASRQVGQSEVKAVALHKRAVGVQRLGDYYVSTLPKTIYDCFYLPDYAGGVSKVLRAIYYAKFSKEQWKEFLGYVDKFETKQGKRRIGSALALLKKTGQPAPVWVIKRFGQNALKLNELELLSWWYG